ncbi:MAG: hypothetical protein ACRECV_14435 [Xanthobacteraceae bacterium]
MTQEDESTESDSEITAEGHRKADAIEAGKPKPCCCKPNYPKKKYFSQPENRVAFATLIILGIYTGITILLWCNSADQVQISRDSEIASNRAWIAPLTIKLIKDEVIRPNQIITYVLSYENTGHSPALETTFEDNEEKRLPFDQIKDVLAKTPGERGFIGNPTCVPGGKAFQEQAAHHGWPAIYPNTPKPYTRPLQSAAPATPDIADGHTVQIVRGCFLYNTLNLTQVQSKFCFWLDPSNWKFHRCPYGNDAY